MLRLIPFIFVVIQIGAVKVPLAGTATRPVSHPVQPSLLDQVQNDFSVDGLPIHPMILEHFMPSFKGGPEVLRVDVKTAMQRMSVLDPPIPDPYRPSWWLYRWKDGARTCTMEYLVTGRLGKETFVIRAAANYGGTASILEVLVVRVNRGPKLFQNEPALVVMTLERILPLPGLDATVKVEGSGVKITRPAREGERAYEQVYQLTPEVP